MCSRYNVNVVVAVGVVVAVVVVVLFGLYILQSIHVAFGSLEL